MWRSKGPYRRPEVKQWCNFLNSIKPNVVISDNLARQELAEIGYFPSVNPASYFSIDQLWDSFRQYDLGPNPDSNVFYNNSHFAKAISLAFKLFANFGDKLEPISEPLELYSVINKEASAGLPTRERKEVAFPKSYMRMQDVISGKRALHPCLCQFRTQRKLDAFGKPVGKTRSVFAYPLDATLLEAKYFYPINERILKRRTPYSGGISRAALGSRLTSTLRKKYIYEFDYSRFDSSIPVGLIRICFEIFKTWFHVSEHANLNLIFQYFINTPLVMPDGNLYVGKAKGVPSGSCFTQLVDSIVNFIVCIAVDSKFNLGVSWYETHVVGDDSIFTSNQYIEIEAISRFVQNFGFTINASKSRLIVTGQRFHFVGFYFVHGLMTKPIEEVLTSAVYTERHRKVDNEDEHVGDVFREIGLLSLDSVPVLRAWTKAGHRGDLIDSIGSSTSRRHNHYRGSGFLQYNAKYVNKDGGKRILGIGGQYIQ